MQQQLLFVYPSLGPRGWLKDHEVQLGTICDSIQDPAILMAVVRQSRFLQNNISMHNTHAIKSSCTDNRMNRIPFNNSQSHRHAVARKATRKLTKCVIKSTQSVSSSQHICLRSAFVNVWSHQVRAATPFRTTKAWRP